MNRRAFISNSAKLALALGGLSIAPIDVVHADPTYRTYSATDSMGFRAEKGNFAKFVMAERDQTHCMFNNTWADPDGSHEAMIAALSTSDKFEAMAAWDWLPWGNTYTHAWHSIYHGLDTAAGINTDNRFPFQISQYRSLTLDIPNVYVAADGKWGLGFDMFLFKQQPFTQANVQAEIFVMLKRQGYPNPSEMWSTTSCGVTYGCGKWLPVRTCTSSGAKTIQLYRSETNQHLRLLKRTQNQRPSTRQQHSTGVFLGSEPIEGAGTWRIDSFYTNLEASSALLPAKPCFCFVVSSLNPFTQITGASIQIDGVPVATSKNTSVAVGSAHRFQIQPPSGYRFKQFTRYYWNKVTGAWSLLDFQSSSLFDWTMPQPPSACPDGWIVLAETPAIRKRVVHEHVICSASISWMRVAWAQKTGSCDSVQTCSELCSAMLELIWTCSSKSLVSDSGYFQRPLALIRSSCLMKARGRS